jgi:lipopolysaccharide export system protein LptC
MSVELHLPDLPQVPISLGPVPGAPPRIAMPWHLRLREVLTTYLPLLLMGLLALATWWLVKNSPRPQLADEPRAVATTPDYTMSRFSMERFDRQGRLKLRIEGDQMRHIPTSDRIEVDQAVIRAVAADGRITLARARQALGSGDGAELQLLGGAEVTSQRAGAATLVMRSEFLQVYFEAGRIHTDREVQVAVGDTQLKAKGGLDYDHPTGRLELKGPLRAVLAHPAR